VTVSVIELKTKKCLSDRPYRNFTEQLEHIKIANGALLDTVHTLQGVLYFLCALQFYVTCLNVLSDTPVWKVHPSQLWFSTKSTNYSYNVHISYTKFCPFGTNLKTVDVNLTPLITADTALIFTKLWITTQHHVAILHSELYPDWPVQAVCYYWPSMVLTVPNCMTRLITARRCWDIVCAECRPNSYVPFRQCDCDWLFSQNSYMLDNISGNVEARILVNPSIYHSEVLKVRKMLVNASISGFYQTISVNAGIRWHLLVKVRFGWLWLCFVSVCVLTLKYQLNM
jgi:hypothetical protein